MNNQPIIDTTTKQDEYIEVLKKHFPSVISRLEDGSYLVDGHQLQLMIEPKNSSLKEDGYGLKWVGKKEAYHNAYIPNNKILKPLLDDSKNFDTTGNVLIKGDNLDALKLLRENYFEQIKMIYIDPPYNTESDEFIYSDNFTKSQEDVLEELGYSAEQKEYIKNIAGAKTHSGWLSFMYPRLLLARDLLKDDGVIFISIDDNEQANLKLLCDEVFGQENFVGDLIRKTRSSANNSDAGFNIQHENCIIFAKNKLILTLEGKEKNFENYINLDNDLNGEWISDNPTANLDKREKINNFEVKNPHTGKVDIPPRGRHWVFNLKDLESFIKSGKIIFKKMHKPNERGFILKRYKKDIKSDVHLLNSLEAINNEYLNQVGTKERNDIFNKDIFDYPKPVAFLVKLVKSSTSSSDLVLDFFAGSGTTGDAVLQLNAEDGGARKFILVQLPEAINPKKNSVAYKFISEELNKKPTIFEITAERLGVTREFGNYCTLRNLRSYPILS